MIKNVKVFGLEESIKASGYPMTTKLENIEEDVENLEKCMGYGLEKIVDILDNQDELRRTFSINEEMNCVNMIVGNLDEPVLIDFEDLVKVSKKGWTYGNSRGYIRSTSEPYIELQRYLLDSQEYVVDHKNRNVLDNRRSNLRLATRSQNLHNCSLSKNNSSGVIGVHFSESKNRWVASLYVNGKSITRKCGY